MVRDRASLKIAIRFCIKSALGRVLSQVTVCMISVKVDQFVVIEAEAEKSHDGIQSSMGGRQHTRYSLIL